jgi:hypothetical protein
MYSENVGISKFGCGNSDKGTEARKDINSPGPQVSKDRTRADQLS